MVLSNKKLKQKLRAELLAKTVNDPDLVNQNPDSNSEPRSLKSILDSVTQKPRLSKREKRRKNPHSPKGSSQKTEEKGEDVGEEKVEGVGKKDKKKRKREKEEKKVNNKKPKKKRKKSKDDNKEKNESEEQVILQVENETESEVVEDVARKVYVGGVPYRYTEEDIRYYFEGCGTITDVDCMKFPDTGKFRGIAIISFATEAAAKEALALDRAEMAGMQLTIQPYKSTRANSKRTGFAPKMVEGYNRIYVGNLSWDITEEDLKKLFSDCDVSSIRFGTDKETGEFRGYAHVDFSDSVSVAMALKLDQEIVHGRPVKISCAVKKDSKTPSRSHPTPTSNRTPTNNEAPAIYEAPTTGDKTDNGDFSVDTGKMRKRTCYECGRKGHSFSVCPNKKPSDNEFESGSHPTSDEVPTSNEAPPTNEALTTGTEAENGDSSVATGKMRRRTCYECGQKGHSFSVCPNKKTAENEAESRSHPMSNEVPSSNEAPPTNEALKTGIEADNGVPTVSSGKMRRRTCYECGQKGHISSACPNKETADTTNTKTD